MKNRNIGYIVLAVLICVVACRKVDTTYRDYVNTQAEFNGNAYQYLQEVGQYDSMLSILNRFPSLKDSLENEDITLYSIPNNSFALALTNINNARLDSVPTMPLLNYSTMDSAVLDTFFCRYILRGKIYSDSLKTSSDGLLLESLNYDYLMNAKYVSTDASGFLGGGPGQVEFSYRGADSSKWIFVRYWVSVNSVTSDIRAKNAVINVLPSGHAFGFGSDFIKAVNRR